MHDHSIFSIHIILTLNNILKLYILLYVSSKVCCTSTVYLISVENNNFSTMALAGTKSYLGSRDVVWGSKERREQQLVTDYISEELKGFNLSVGRPFTLKAGSILHICSIINGVLRDTDQITELIKKLHPTPAVCGIPMKVAKEFIIENENYDREYYTGYLGRIDSNKGLNLFVNLRCMKVEDDYADLYMGGGITMESEPINEWKETCVKSLTMKRVLS
jgi:isochorismate synthase